MFVTSKIIRTETNAFATSPEVRADVDLTIAGARYARSRESSWRTGRHWLVRNRRQSPRARRSSRCSARHLNVRRFAMRSRTTCWERCQATCAALPSSTLMARSHRIFRTTPIWSMGRSTARPAPSSGVNQALRGLSPPGSLSRTQTPRLERRQAFSVGAFARGVRLSRGCLR